MPFWKPPREETALEPDGTTPPDQAAPPMLEEEPTSMAMLKRDEILGEQPPCER